MGKGLSLHMGEPAFYEYKLELSYSRISSDITYHKSALNPFFLMLKNIPVFGCPLGLL